MKKSNPINRAFAIVVALVGPIFIAPVSAGVVFSASFETAVVSGFDDNTVPSTGWVGATLGYGSSNRGLYNETVAWPATPAFTTPYGNQAYYLNYTNSGLTTAQGAISGVLTAGTNYKVSFNTAVTSGTGSANYLVQLVAFAPADNNAARENAQTPPGTVLASATGAVTTTNMSASSSIVFTPAAGNAHLGKEIGIRLIKSNGSVLYDNIRLIVGHDMNPTPASGVTIAGGNVGLNWTNMPPDTGSDTYVDVWFGTNPAALTKVVNGGINTNSTTVSAPSANTYYWRVDSYLDGSATGTPVTGDVFVFYVTDTDLDGFPDSYELANTTPSSNISLNPSDNPDADGLTNIQEFQYGTNPNNPDTDGDTLLDGPELTGVGSRPATNPVDADSDDDGLSDGVESNTGIWASAGNTGTNPQDADGDNDGLKDGAETNNGTYVDRFNTGSNPYLADTDADGAWDWYEATATFTNPSNNAATSPIPYPLPDPDGSTGATNKPVKVYIMAGQSNTVGIGQVNGTALGTLETIAKRENKFPNLVDGSNNWSKRNDVIYKGVVTATAAGPLTAGQGASSTQLGPELGFGQIMGWYHDEPVLIIKASQGNRSLGWDFCPPGSARWVLADKTYPAYGESPQSWLTASGAPAPGGWYAGKQYDDCFLAESRMGMIPWATATVYASGVYVRHNGAAYTSKSAHTADASSEPGTGASWTTFWNVYSAFNASDILANGVLQGLPTTGNNLNGRTYEIAGFCWWQGHKDQDGSNNIYGPRYEPNLVKLINALRADFNAPNAPFVVASIGFGGEPLNTKENDFKQVYNAQMAVGNPTLHPEFAGTVKSVDILKYWRTVEESPKNQDYHYNQNAETYMLVGDAMGRAMLAMQNDTSPPAPSPLTFAIDPTAVNTSTVGMVAATAIDVSGPVQYYFENTTNSIVNNSGWITATSWNNTGLTNGVSYNFRVKAKDNKDNETGWSNEVSAAPGNDITAPVPSTMSFAVLPTAQGENAITMTATTATDINGVQYYFDCTVGGGTDSDWQSSPIFTATGLSPGTSYTYVVRAKDSAGNITADSATASATTAAPDTSPPSPATMNFAVPPTASGVNAISMTATTATDVSGVQYFFEATNGGTSSGWQDSPTYTDTSLSPGTEYGYRVRARDKSPAYNANEWSPAASATTGLPDTTPPTVSGFSPAFGSANVAVATNLSVTFNEEITIGTGLITIKNLTDATQSTIDITDGSQVSAAGAVLTINPTVNLANSKNYAIQIAVTAIKDLEENFFAGILNDTTWNFTTVAPPAGGIVFADNFEPGANTYGGSTPNVSTYTVASTSGQANATLWTRATSGYGSTSNGLIDESENGGANFTDPSGSQAYGFRYTNSGVTSAAGKIGALTAGMTITVTFDVVRDGWNAGLPYYAYLVLFESGAARNATETHNKNTAAVLAQGLGNANSDGTYKTVSFSYIVGNNVVDNNGAASGTSTTWLPSLLSKDIAIRFGGATTSANIDNVSISITGGSPGPVASFAISPITSPLTVGTPITGITLTAKDSANATATSFTGSVTFGGTGGFAGTSANFVAGVLTNVSVTPTVAGSNLTFTVTDGASPTPHTGSATIATINPAANTYATWIGTFPGAAAMPGFTEDADGDGIKNGVENFFGTNPGIFSAGLIAGTKNGNTFTFTHPQNATPASDVSAVYRWSKDLLTFNANAATDGDVTTVTFTTQLNTPSPGITTVTATVTGTATATLFVDIKVTQN